MGVTGASSPTLRDALASRHQLVVLDNFEHLLSAVPTVAELVARAPNVTFLVTSRAVLHLYGEHQFEVAPLPVPDDRETDFEAMAASPAVSLFSQRARAVDQSFRLDREERRCRRRDLPAARRAPLGDRTRCSAHHRPGT